MRKTIKITEGDLHRIVKESVKRVLNENRGLEMDADKIVTEFLKANFLKDGELRIPIEWTDEYSSDGAIFDINEDIWLILKYDAYGHYFPPYELKRYSSWEEPTYSDSDWDGSFIVRKASIEGNDFEGQIELSKHLTDIISDALYIRDEETAEKLFYRW